MLAEPSWTWDRCPMERQSAPTDRGTQSYLKCIVALFEATDCLPLHGCIVPSPILFLTSRQLL
jgi:hypothetical protein